MPNSDNLDPIIELAEQAVRSIDLQLVEARFTQQGRNRSLEVTIHRQGGHVTIDDCEQVSRKLEDLLDNQDPPLVSSAFLLEVVSPGIDRQLKTPREFAVFKGCLVDILSRERLADLGFNLRGTLLHFQDGVIMLGNPQLVKEGKKAPAAKRHLQLVPDMPEQIEIDLSKLISVKLHPQELPREQRTLHALQASDSKIDDN